ncbi:hypothetical protein EDC56_1126 [Sinobacterium caligoides]|uniref:Uncharacterized protein n=1 Tax=Sinobacterium caligoides TaxID=933926 RepID=A0A3N2E0G3_9GAMM|nr:hypothetical protein [Sinobacterium caligoides]ROS05586.1 hypothetical protein EDC56_1126 [Sinobacterium caligoides]
MPLGIFSSLETDRNILTADIGPLGARPTHVQIARCCQLSLQYMPRKSGDEVPSDIFTAIDYAFTKKQSYNRRHKSDDGVVRKQLWAGLTGFAGGIAGAGLGGITGGPVGAVVGAAAGGGAGGALGAVPSRTYVHGARDTYKTMVGTKGVKPEACARELFNFFMPYSTVNNRFRSQLELAATHVISIIVEDGYECFELVNIYDQEMITRGYAAHWGSSRIDDAIQIIAKNLVSY